MRHRPIREVEWTRARDIRRELESDTKDGLVHAAREVFAVKGYDSATIGDITAAASVSRPTFYVYFASKSEIFRVIAARLRDELLEAHHHPQQVAEDPVLVSRASMEAFIRLYADNLEILDEIEKRAQTDATIAEILDVMRGKPYRRTLRHIDSVREAGLARPMVDEEYAANLMRAVSMDAAAAIRGDRARTRYYVDQATRVYLALIGYTGGLAALDGDRDSADPV
jgi:AcrR family transcriptional regulator